MPIAGHGSERACCSARPARSGRPLNALVPPRPAATVALLRPGRDLAEVLLIERPSTMAFGAGLQVFPGGRVDPEDADGGPVGRPAEDAAAALGGNVGPADALALHRAAIRELAEEAGIHLADPADLTPVAHWTTPPFMTRRFSTWFFVADLPADADPIFEADEVASHRWLTPRAALDHLAAGEIAMWVPTTSVLQQLDTIGARSAADVRRAVAMSARPDPAVVSEDEDRCRLRFGSVGAVPGRIGETTLLGRREIVVVDPGDPAEDAIALIEATAERRGGRIRSIVLTSADPDQAAGAEALAIPHEIPIRVAPGAGRHLPYAVDELADGEDLGADIEIRVRLGPANSGRLGLETASAGE